MATAAKRTLKSIERAGEDVSDALIEQIESLRKEVESISTAVSKYGGNALDDVQHGVAALAKDMRHQGTAVARQVSRQASAAGKAVQENPVPVIVALGVVALLSALIFTRD